MSDEQAPIPEQEITGTELELKTLRDQLEEYKDKYLRTLAESENMRKRMQKEKQEMTRFAVENVITDLLRPIDNLENALKFTEGLSPEVRQWASGFQMILGQFKEVLSDHGVTPFSSQGMHFDPKFHYAIETEETDAHEEGTILQEFVTGYKSGDHIVRPANVKVAKRPVPTEEKN